MVLSRLPLLPGLPWPPVLVPCTVSRDKNVQNTPNLGDLGLNWPRNTPILVLFPPIWWFCVPLWAICQTSGCVPPPPLVETTSFGGNHPLWWVCTLFGAGPNNRVFGQMCHFSAPEIQNLSQNGTHDTNFGPGPEWDGNKYVLYFTFRAGLYQCTNPLVLKGGSKSCTIGCVKMSENTSDS